MLKNIINAVSIKESNHLNIASFGYITMSLEGVLDELLNY